MSTRDSSKGRGLWPETPGCCGEETGGDFAGLSFCARSPGCCCSRRAPVASPADPSLRAYRRHALALNGWYTSNVTVNWQRRPGESAVDRAAIRGTLTRRHAVTRQLTCAATSDNDEHGHRQTDDQDRQDRAGGSARCSNARPTRTAGTTGRSRSRSPGRMRRQGSRRCTSVPVRRSGQRRRRRRRVVHRRRRQYRRGVSFPFKYDATPPSIFADDRNAREPQRADLVAEVQRHDGRRGLQDAGPERPGRVGDLPRHGERRQGHRLSPSAASTSTASSASTRLRTAPSRSSSLVATGALLSPTPGLQITMKSPPTLAWARAKGASYYNVQLIRARAQGAERLARAYQLPTAANVAVQGTPLSTAARRLPLVRLARIRADLRRPIRAPPAWKQLVRRDEVGRRVRRHAAALLFAVGALLLTPGAPASRTCPATRLRPWSRRSSPEPSATQRLVHDQRHRQLVGHRPGVDHPLDDRLRRGHVHGDTTGTPLTCTAESDGGETTVCEDVQGRQDRAGDDRDTVAVRRLERLVQPRLSRRLRRDRRDLRARVVLPGRDLQRA